MVVENEKPRLHSIQCEECGKWLYSAHEGQFKFNVKLHMEKHKKKKVAKNEKHNS